MRAASLRRAGAGSANADPAALIVGAGGWDRRPQLLPAEAAALDALDTTALRRNHSRGGPTAHGRDVAGLGTSGRTARRRLRQPSRSSWRPRPVRPGRPAGRRDRARRLCGPRPHVVGLDRLGLGQARPYPILHDPTRRAARPAPYPARAAWWHRPDRRSPSATALPYIGTVGPPPARHRPLIPISDRPLEGRDTTRPISGNWRRRLRRRRQRLVFCPVLSSTNYTAARTEPGADLAVFADAANHQNRHPVKEFS